MFTTGIQDFVINRRSDLQLLNSDTELYIEGVGRFSLANISRMLILGSSPVVNEEDKITISGVTSSPLALGDVLTAAIKFRSVKDSDFDAGTMQNYYLKPLVFQFVATTTPLSNNSVASDFAAALTNVLSQTDGTSYFIDSALATGADIDVTFSTWFRYIDSVVINGPGGVDYGIEGAVTRTTVGQEGHGLPEILHERIKSLNAANNDPLYKPTTHVIDTATYTELVFDYDYTSPSVGLQSQINGLENDRSRFSIFINEDIIDDDGSDLTLFPLYAPGTAPTLYSLMASILTVVPGTPALWSDPLLNTYLDNASQTGSLIQVTNS